MNVLCDFTALTVSWL